MILAKSVKSFYLSHKAELLEMFYNEQPKPLDFDKLSTVYIDKKGRKYFRYENDNDLPVERYGKVLEYMQYIAKGLTAAEDEKLDNEIEQAIESGLKDPAKKGAVQIGVIINERRLRRKLCIHTELIYNYLAVQWVREDENPNVFDKEIHEDKVTVLQAENKDGAVSFFFQHKELKRLRDLLEMSREDWERYMSEYQIQVQRLQTCSPANRINKIIQRGQRDFDEMILMLAGGDVIQAKEIKRGSIGDYLIKFDLYVKKLEQ